MFSNKIKMSLSFLLVLVMGISLLCTTAFATTISDVLDGKITLTDTQNTISLTDGVVTATAKGNMFSKKSNTITITNNTDTPATLGFNYTVTKASSFTIDGENAGTSGTFSKLLASGKSTVFVITSNSGFSNLTVTLTMKDFSLEEAAASSSNVTFEYDSTVGSITVDGNSVTSGTVKEVSLENGAALVATAKNGSAFLGWVDDNGKVLSTSASYKFTPTEAEMTVCAAFAGTAQTSNGWFLAGGNRLYDDLNDAASYAASAENTGAKTVVLMNNATLPAGNYTIPAGVTFLIPFDTANTIYTTKPETDATGSFLFDAGTYVQPTIYRTLNMASGANITVNGAISLPAKIHAAGGGKAMAGSPVGNVPRINMEGNSSITVNSGGKLYCYGFITGNGSVSAMNGSVIYECFQIMDYRGGSGSTNIGNSVFPLSQYYVQNIEVPLTLHSGAVEYGATAVVVSKTKQETSVPFIGSGSMFTINSGSVTKRYDGTADRLIIDVQGNLTMGSVSLSLSTGQSINSEKYILGINNNMTINFMSGTTTVGQRVALQPGSKITIASGAKVTFSKDAFVYDGDDWGDFCYAEDSGLSTIQSGNNNNAQTYNYSAIAVRYAPGRTYTRTAADLVDAVIEVEGTLEAETGKIYTTVGGGNICGKNGGKVTLTAGTAGTTYQARMTSSSDLTYQEIGYTPAKLQNSDDTCVQSATDTYTYTDGFWRCSDSKHAFTEEITKAADCQNPGVKTLTCSVCYLTDTESIPATGVHNSACGHEAAIGDILYTTLTEALDAASATGSVQVFTENPAEHVIHGTKSFVRCGREGAYTYEGFTLAVTEWYIEAYTNGDTLVGFGAKFTGSTEAEKALTGIGFRVGSAADDWASDHGWTKNNGTANHFTCLVELPENTDPLSARALVAFGEICYASSEMKLSDIEGKIDAAIKEYKDAPVNEYEN